MSTPASALALPYTLLRWNRLAQPLVSPPPLYSLMPLRLFATTTLRSVAPGPPTVVEAAVSIWMPSTPLPRVVTLGNLALMPTRLLVMLVLLVLLPRTVMPWRALAE